MKVIELPSVPQTAISPNLQGGSRIGELISLGKDERVLGLTSFAEDSPGLAVGTRAAKALSATWRNITPPLFTVGVCFAARRVSSTPKQTWSF